MFLKLRDSHIGTGASYDQSMPLRKLAHDAKDVIIQRATWSGSQNFLGARWVEFVVNNCPIQARERLALRFLSLSPHYFFDPDVQSEHVRNRKSRQILADILIAPYLTEQAHVLDYGCGPGYLAAAVADKAAHVDAVDISRGVLACAGVLNSRPNISYQTPDELGKRSVAADVAYSFAVAQHLRTPALTQMLATVSRQVRSGGVLLLHFAVAGQVWRTEAEWLASRSLAGRAKLHYGLNCFGRSAADMTDLVTRSGFTDVSVNPLSGCANLPVDDIADQHLLIARRR
jgi:2-polyprenyl-3-methyl-5-hydroxy-6-metoxy-1,4-benzoquinol methylase